MGNTEVLKEMLNSVPSSHLQMAVNKHSKVLIELCYLGVTGEFHMIFKYWFTAVK